MTFVLVHGAWGGSHGFRLVRRSLQARGHEVFTPSLTGVGERSHLTGPLVGLSTHVLDVANTVLYEDLRDVVLLGFSYGGMVVSGALEQIGDRVRELVLLDAFLPDDGDSVASLTGGALGGGEDGIGAFSPAEAHGSAAPWAIPALPRDYDDPAVGAWANPRRSAQPMRTLTEPVRLCAPLEEWPFGRTYIRATQDPNGAMFDASAARARTSDAWRYHEIATTHMVPENRPEELASLLQTLVS